MKKKQVLFVCVHNIARSQMAEAFLKSLAGDRFDVKSAGLEPGDLNPLVVAAMAEVGIDIANKKSKSVFDLYKKGEQFDYVITVCDEASAERCPVFAGASNTIRWNFTDPSRLEGSPEDKMKMVRHIRDRIKSRIEEWLKTGP
jgi:arsenate reductase